MSKEDKEISCDADSVPTLAGYFSVMKDTVANGRMRMKKLFSGLILKPTLADVR